MGMVVLRAAASMKPMYLELRACLRRPLRLVRPTACPQGFHPHRCTVSPIRTAARCCIEAQLLHG